MNQSQALELLRRGPDGVKEWNRLRSKNHQVPDLKSVELVDVDLTGANLSGIQLGNAKMMQCVLDKADLTGASLDSADLFRARFREAILVRTTLANATLVEADFGGCDLNNANLYSSDCESAIFDRATLRQCSLMKCNLRIASFFKADLLEANLSGAHLAHAKCVSSAKNLGSVYINEPTKEFNKCEMSRFDRWFCWEAISRIGRLPLFGISYSVLVLLPVGLFLIAFYNRHAILLRDWAQQVSDDTSQLPVQDPAVVGLVDQLKRLEPQPIPSQSLLLFISMALLAIASTIYALRCPSRVQEFSRDKWRDEFKNPILHYWASSWSYPVERCITLTCYVMGGLGALWVFCNKLWRAFWYIWEYSTFSLF